MGLLLRSILVVQLIALAVVGFRLPFPVTRSHLQPRKQTQKYCVDKKIKPLEQPQGSERSDADNSWQTFAKETIVPIPKEKFNVRPELITFDAFDTLIAPSQSIGRWYREAMNSACDMRIRLPRPSFFDAAFENAYKEMAGRHPCFGAQSGMAARDWWFEVVKMTYQRTENMGQIEPEELEQLLPEVFENLYADVFGSKAGWIIKEDAVYVLTKLKEWRDIGNGPKIGIVSNFDDRLSSILKELGIHDFFDFVLTSYEVKTEKPHAGIFEAASQAVGVSEPALCFHVGNSVDTDVEGAAAAGWTPLRYNEWFDDEFPDWNDIDDTEEADSGADRRRALLEWGRKALDRHPETGGLEWVELWGLDDILTLFGFPDDDEKPIRTTVLRGFLQDDANTI
mmetsp:Transcript_14122/g.23494  ORF Transcript_14122/g.23494 Transcript_14122/m.23494 type:complete len:396 (-) Transcript_14122:286-1473(-)|eukprot:CAMPEP_0174963666 /NCGR_PEP_ID=MMETSP0004_2-20121128/5453_1 /TAXON_ID=420556 /ORGANISM="Ochromonas sp., Strain CCMP1393" /LENGTH=395 /DNA_ID=CAMNT_0016212309 /DNA_START=67 /DNA_END=1254 /DNA_ORIENTATION=+